MVSSLRGVRGLFEILKIFYLPEGLCRAESEGGPIVFTFHFIGVDNGTGIFNLEAVFSKEYP